MLVRLIRPEQLLWVKVFEKVALAFADTFEGGFGDQSRFPHVPQLEYLLDRYQHWASAAVREVSGKLARRDGQPRPA